MSDAPPVWRHVSHDSVVHARCSTVADGDFHLDRAGSALAARRAAFAPGSWTQLDEVHGTRVVVVGAPGEHDGEIGDGAVTACRGAVLAVWVGDCVPLVLAHESGAVGVVHAGWRGLLAGVVGEGVAAVRRGWGDGDIAAWIGPSIRACCYEFGPDDLDLVAARFGDTVRATTSGGSSALSMPVAVRAALAECGVALVDEAGPCTRCDHRFFSHRRGDSGRHVVTARTMARS